MHSSLDLSRVLAWTPGAACYCLSHAKPRSAVEGEKGLGLRKESLGLVAFWYDQCFPTFLPSFVWGFKTHKEKTYINTTSMTSIASDSSDWIQDDEASKMPPWPPKELGQLLIFFWPQSRSWHRRFWDWATGISRQPVDLSMVRQFLSNTLAQSNGLEQELEMAIYLALNRVVPASEASDLVQALQWLESCMGTSVLNEAAKIQLSRRLLNCREVEVKEALEEILEMESRRLCVKNQDTFQVATQGENREFWAPYHLERDISFMAGFPGFDTQKQMCKSISTAGGLGMETTRWLPSWCKHARRTPGCISRVGRPGEKPRASFLVLVVYCFMFKYQHGWWKHLRFRRATWNVLNASLDDVDAAGVGLQKSISHWSPVSIDGIAQHRVGLHLGSGCG